jgi:hypothetical protein
VSLFFGVLSWILLGLRFTPILGNGFGTVFLFFPSAAIGLVIGIVARIRCQNKKLAYVAIVISALPFVFLVLIIALFMCSDGWKE